MFFGLEKGQRISFSQFVRHAEQTAGGCPTSPGVDLGMPSLEGGARHAARAAVQERLLRLLPARSASERAGWAPGDPLLTVFFYVSFAD